MLPKLDVQPCYWSLRYSNREPINEGWDTSFSVHQNVETPADGLVAMYLQSLGGTEFAKVDIPAGNKPIFYRILGYTNDFTEVTVVGFGRAIDKGFGETQFEFELWQWKPEKGLEPCEFKYRVPKLIMEQLAWRG